MTPQQKKIRKQRGKLYGEPKFNHTNLGLAFTAILQTHYEITLPHPIPPHIVALMMVAFKATRASRNYQPDSHLDLANYNDFSREFQQSKKNERA